MTYRDATATVGSTPLVDLARLARGQPGRVVAKLELAETPSAITLDQFQNPANPDLHRRTTAMEI